MYTGGCLMNLVIAMFDDQGSV